MGGRTAELLALYGDTGGDTELSELRGDKESWDEVFGKLRLADTASLSWPGWPVGLPDLSWGRSEAPEIQPCWMRPWT